MSRHSRLGYDDSPGTDRSHLCTCKDCPCECNAVPQPVGTDRILDDFELVDATDTDSTESLDAEPDNPVQPVRKPQTPGYRALEAYARCQHKIESFPPHTREEIAWMEGFLFRIDVASQPSSTETSTILSSGAYHDSDANASYLSHSMHVEPGSPSPCSSLAGSMIFGFVTPNTASLNTMRASAHLDLDGIGTQWGDQQNFFTTAPLVLYAEPRFCRTDFRGGFRTPSRSMSLPTTMEAPEHQALSSAVSS